MTNQAEAAQAASGSSFYAGMRILPKPEREAMYAIYAYCRAVDDIADDLGGTQAAREAALGEWRQAIAALYCGGDAGVAAFLAPAVRDFRVRREDFEAVIDGMAMDVARDIRWPAMTELDLYCDRVASAVGRLAVRVFGMDEEPGRLLAHHLGRALQLTNILRDVDEDAAIGRVYLPAEALTAAGVPLDELEQVVADPRIDRACRILAERAQGHFDASADIFASRPAGHLIAPRLMYAAYARLLRRMLAAGWQPPRQRVRHSRLALLWTLLRLKLGR
jgi:phytoene synthase